MLDVKERMDDFCKTYQSQIKAAGNDTTQEHNEALIMAEIENLGGASKKTIELLNQMEEYINMAKDCQRQVEYARLMAQIEIDNWAPIDTEKLVE